MIEVSAGVIYDEAGRILICKRGQGRRNAHLWEFPGGKREKGETAEECLARELLEELSLPVTEIQPMCAGEESGIRFTFLTGRTAAQPIPTEHEDVRFVHLREMLGYDFCPADVPVARRLALDGVHHFIWDFDGTLVDTYPAMVRAFVAAAEDHCIAITPERALSLMKNCLHHALVTVSGESRASVDGLRQAFRVHEQEELAKGVSMLRGMPETLRTLHQMGGRHYVATHRDLQCRDLLDSTGVLSLFTGFVTQEDGLPRKPAPDMLLHLMDRHGLSPEECVMIGDRPLDTLAGRAAGMLSILIDTEDRFDGADCDLRIASPQELTELFTIMR